MSLLLPGGFLAWQSEWTYTKFRSECQQEGASHDRCGFQWAAVPGLPNTEIEIWPQCPHGKDTLWSYQVRRGGVVVSAQKLVSDEFGVKRFANQELSRFLRPFAWVSVLVGASPDGKWIARLRQGESVRELRSDTAAGDMDSGFVAALGSVFQALRKPVKLRVLESTGLLRKMIRDGWVVKRSPIGRRLEALEQASRRHFVAIPRTTKEQAERVTARPAPENQP